MLPARQVRRRRAQAISQNRESREGFSRAAGHQLPVTPEHPRGSTQVLLDGERPEHTAATWHLRDSLLGHLFGSQRAQIDAIEMDRAPRKRGDASNGAQHSRFTGAVGPKQSNDLTHRDVEIDPKQHLHAVVGDFD